MNIKLAEVTKRVQALLDDPTGSMYDDGYVLTFINQRYDDLNNKLSQLDLKYTEEVFVLANVPANTTDLISYQDTGQPLEEILLPTFIEWKRPGDSDSQYIEVKYTRRLPDPDGAREGVMAYEWRGGKVYITPSSIIVDIRVRARVMSVNLVDPDDDTVRGVTNIVAYMVAELIADVRGNDRLATRYKTMGEEALDDFLVLAVKDNQRKSFRIPRMSGRRSRRVVPYIRG